SNTGGFLSARSAMKTSTGLLLRWRILDRLETSSARNGCSRTSNHKGHEETQNQGVGKQINPKKLSSRQNRKPSCSFVSFVVKILDMDLSAKQRLLEDSLRSLGRTLVAYSGGVDSAYLAWVANKVLGDDMLAVIADSPSLARAQLQDALAFAQEHGIA